MGKALYNRFRPVKSGAAGFYLDLPTVQHLYLLVDLMDEKAEMTCTSLEDPGITMERGRVVHQPRRRSQQIEKGLLVP